MITAPVGNNRLTEQRRCNSTLEEDWEFAGGGNKGGLEENWWMTGGRKKRGLEEDWWM